MDMTTSAPAWDGPYCLDPSLSDDEEGEVGTVDVVVIAVYFVLILMVGLWVSMDTFLMVYLTSIPLLHPFLINLLSVFCI